MVQSIYKLCAKFSPTTLKPRYIIVQRLQRVFQRDALKYIDPRGIDRPKSSKSSESVEKDRYSSVVLTLLVQYDRIFRLVSRISLPLERPLLQHGSKDRRHGHRSRRIAQHARSTVQPALVMARREAHSCRRSLTEASSFIKGDAGHGARTD